MKRVCYRLILVLAIMPWHSSANARDLLCGNDANPIVSQFLNRYIDELMNCRRTDLSVYDKMADDKFIIYEGSLENINLITDSTSCTVIRYDDMAYEVIWSQSEQVLLRVAFPIQYELLLGKPKAAIEKEMQDFLQSEPLSIIESSATINLDSIAPGIYRTSPVRHFQIPSLTDCCYYVKDTTGIKYYADTANWNYTLSNLFHTGLNLNCNMDIIQSVYGFNRIEYSVSLVQWINYCQQMGLITYVSIEEEYEDYYKVLVLAESKELNFNHILSVAVPKNMFETDKVLLPAKLSAFIPTHNVSELYQQFTNTKTKQREWEN